MKPIVTTFSEQISSMISAERLSDISLRATVLLAAATVVTVTLRRHSAASRHLVWVLALAGVVALPIIQSGLPSWKILPNDSVVRPDRSTDSERGARHRTEGDHHRSANLAVDSDGVIRPIGKWPQTAFAGEARLDEQSLAELFGNAEAKEQSPDELLNPAFGTNDDEIVLAVDDEHLSKSSTAQIVAKWVVCVWSVGAALGCFPMLLGSLSVWDLRRKSQSMTAPLASELQQLVVERCLRRRVVGILSENRRMPMTWGIFWPVLLLPVEAKNWTAERRRLVLLHELAHIQRWDCLTQLFGQFVRALHWFNPLAWFALRQMQVEQERACDDRVLIAGASAEKYASELLSLTTRLPRASWDTAVALAMSRATRLEQRLTSILNGHCDRHPLSLTRAVVMSLLMVVACVGISIAQKKTANAAPSDNRQLALADQLAVPAGETKTAENAQPAKLADSTKNTLKLGNADFEGNVHDGAIPESWHPAHLAETRQFVKLVVDDIAHSGKRSAMIAIDKSHPAQPVFYNWLGGVTDWKPGQAIEVSAWVKTENVSVSPALVVQCWSKDEKLLAIAPAESSHSVTGTKDWTHLTTPILIPEGTEKVFVRAGLEGASNRGAKIWFDDFAVAKTTDELAKAATKTLTEAEQEQLRKAEAQQLEAAKAAVSTTNSLQDAVAKISQFSAHPIDSNALSEAAIRGMIDSLKDPYSTLITADQLKELYGQLEGKVAGIGAALGKEESGVVVKSVVLNSPAMRGGLKPSDVIVSVNGQPASELADTVKAIRGAVGTEVTLTIRRANQPDRDMVLKRGEIRIPSVRGLSVNEQGQWQHWLDVDQKIAFVQVAEFTGQTSEDLKVVLAQLKEQGVRGLVLDLRGNPGGQLMEVIKVAGLFLKDAVVVQTRGRTPMETNDYRTSGETLFADVPLIVVIDSNTASAGEVLAAALKDNQRAMLVGERTFGKGSVQSILPLGESGSALKLTTAEMLSPSGHSLHRSPDAKSWGVDPHDGYFVPLTTKERETRVKQRRELESGSLKVPQPVTPEVAEKQLADSQLSAALKSLIAKRQTGEFAKTGKPLAEQQAQWTQLEELRKQREALRLKLEQLDRELGSTR